MGYHDFQTGAKNLGHSTAELHMTASKIGFEGFQLLPRNLSVLDMKA